MHNLMRFKSRGSYTVEAAFIVPMILGIIFSLIYFIIYERDFLTADSMLKEQVCIMAMENTPYSVNDSGTKIRKSIQDNMWFFDIGQIDINKNIISVSGTLNARTKVNIPVMERFFPAAVTFRCSEKFTSSRPEVFVRYDRKR